MQDKTNIPMVIDLDHDGLDDRLQKGQTSTNTVNDVLNRIDELHVTNLSEDLVQKMLDNMTQEMDDLLENAKHLERIVHNEIITGNYNIVDKTRKSLRLMKREYNGLSDNRNALLVQIQERRLHINLKKRIGSTGVLLMNWTSMILTLVVLSLMFVDLSVTPREDWLNTWNIFYIDSLCCIFFIWEFSIQYRCADDKKWFLKTHWIDLLTAIPIPPSEGSRFIRLGRTFRFVRLLRVLRLLRVFRALKTVFILSKTLRYLHDLMDLKTMQRTIAIVSFVIVTGGVLITLVEPNPSPHGIQTLSESLWWSFSTVVTGGYADLYNPQNFGGQVLTAILVISGMILVGVFTATLTTVYMGDDNSEIEKQQTEMHQQLEELQKELGEIKATLQKHPFKEP
jgi:voltage-gated potassium channel